MEPSDMNKDNYSGSEQQGDDSMNLDDDKSDAIQVVCTGEDFESEASVDMNVGDECLRSQSGTSGNDGRKRQSQSSYPFTEKVSRNVCDEEHEPQEDNISVHESELLKASAGVSGFTKATTIPDAKSIENEPSVTQCPVKCEDGSVILSNDGQGSSKADISSASTSSDAVEILEEIRMDHFEKDDHSAFYERYAQVINNVSELLKTKEVASRFSNFMREPTAENIKDESPVNQCPVKYEDISSNSTSSEEVEILNEVKKPSILNTRSTETSAAAENIKDEPTVSQCPEKCEGSEMLSNDDKDDSISEISSASSEEVEFLKEVKPPSYYKDELFKCAKCGQYFSLEDYKTHRSRCTS